MQPSHVVTLSHGETTELVRLFLSASDDGAANDAAARVAGPGWSVIGVERWSVTADAAEAVRAALSLRQPMEWSEAQQQIVEATLRRGMDPAVGVLARSLAGVEAKVDGVRREHFGAGTMLFALAMLALVIGATLLAVLYFGLRTIAEAVRFGGGG